MPHTVFINTSKCLSHTNRPFRTVHVYSRAIGNTFIGIGTSALDRTSSVTSMLNCLSWPTLEERRRQYRLAVMYRILHNQVDIHWQSFLTKTSSCTRGYSCRLFVPFCKNHVYASSFFPRISKDWNNLTFDPADAPSLDIFTRKLRNDNA